jgi:Purple acid Phosphatase, N-terminal domain
MKLIGIHEVLFLAISLALSQPAAGQVSPYTPKEILPPAKRAAQIAITEGPSLDSFRNNEAIIRWTSNNPGGPDEHFGIVSYGIDPHQLNGTAKSHVRLNQGHAYTIFRVRLENVKPGTTYYYTIGSMGGDGRKDNLKSAVYQFSTPR